MEAGYPLKLFELKGRVFALIHALEQSGAYVHIPRQDREYAIEFGLRMLRERHLVLETDASYVANPKELVLVKYYANAIQHLLGDRGPHLPVPDAGEGFQSPTKDPAGNP